jgi:hypothetical protein
MFSLAPAVAAARVLATVQDPVVARTSLAHLGLALSPEPPGPAPPHLPRSPSLPLASPR